MNSWETQLRKGVAELAILAVIAHEESYGYQIVEKLQGREGLALSESTVYPVLARLTRDELLDVRTEASPAGPMRRYYRLTLLGKKRLRELSVGMRQVFGSLTELLEGVQL